MSEVFNGTGFNENTPKNLLLGAGTIHKGLKYTGGKWNFAETLVGATSGGNKLTITPEIFKPDVDNVLVSVKGMNFKMGEKASLEINWAELSSELIQTSIIGLVKNNEEINGFDVIESSPEIKEGDYWENIAFVGKKTDGTNVIVILDNALCTSGFEIDNKNKDTAKPKTTFECNQVASGDTRILPYHIYYPKADTTEEQSESTENNVAEETTTDTENQEG